MTKPYATVHDAFLLRDGGYNLSQISRELQVTRSTLRGWFQKPLESFVRRDTHETHERDACTLIDRVCIPEYAYLLGQYLGDGYICAMFPQHGPGRNTSVRLSSRGGRSGSLRNTRDNL